MNQLELGFPGSLVGVNCNDQQCLAVKASVATMMLKEQKLVPKKLPGLMWVTGIMY